MNVYVVAFFAFLGAGASGAIFASAGSCGAFFDFGVGFDFGAIFAVVFDDGFDFACTASRAATTIVMWFERFRIR